MKLQVFCLFLKMSNLDIISEPYCAISNLKNYIICAYPNYLILGKPLKTLTGIKFEKKTYFKIKADEFEKWYDNFNIALDWFNSDQINASDETLVRELAYSINCSVVNGTKELKIDQNDQLTFKFNLCELKAFMLAMCELMMFVFCLEDNFLKIFQLFLNHFMCFNYNLDKVSKKIANLKYSDVNSLCQSICEKHDIQGSVFLLTDYVLKHKLHLLIIYRLRKMCVMPISNLIQRFLE